MTRLKHFVGSFILVLAVSVALGLFAASRLYPALRGYQTVTIRGVSMEPTLPLGSLAYLGPPTELDVGDVVTFRAGSTFVTHRLTASWDGTGHLWLSQGDATGAPDAEPVDVDQIVGRVEAYLPVVGIVADTVSHPAIIFSGIVALSGLALLGSSTRPPRVGNGSGSDPA